MDSKVKILGGLFIIALIYIIFLKGCGSKDVICPEIDIVKIDTVRYEVVIDTIYDTVTVAKYKYITVEIPIPYNDITEKINPSDNFDDFVTEHPWIYEDSISDDTVSIHYRIRTWGAIDDIELGYKVLTSFYIKERSILETEVTKKKRFNGIYGGFDIGVSKLGIMHFSPTLEASGQRFSVNIGYDVYDKAFIGGIKTRIGKK